MGDVFGSLKKSLDPRFGRGGSGVAHVDDVSCCWSDTVEGSAYELVEMSSQTRRDLPRSSYA
jgi:hypothetical protein